MGFKEYYLAEQKEEKDPREKQKVKFFGDQIAKMFGLKVVVKKDRNEWTYTFKSKGLNLGRTTLRLRSSFGDITFGQSSGVFNSEDAQKPKDKVTNAYEKKFGARGNEGEMTFKEQLKKLAKEAKKGR